MLAFIFSFGFFEPIALVLKAYNYHPLPNDYYYRSQEQASVQASVEELPRINCLGVEERQPLAERASDPTHQADGYHCPQPSVFP
jgi:hypothetical protein